MIIKQLCNQYKDIENYLSEGMILILIHIQQNGLIRLQESSSNLKIYSQRGTPDYPCTALQNRSVITIDKPKQKIKYLY